MMTEHNKIIYELIEIISTLLDQVGMHNVVTDVFASVSLYNNQADATKELRAKLETLRSKLL